VKVMNAKRAAEGDVELARFRRETSLIAELSHPHIIRLVDSGWLRVAPSIVPRSIRGDDDTLTAQTVGAIPSTLPPTSRGGREKRRIPFLVMEFIEGETLKELLRQRGRLSAQETVDLLLPVVSALWEAHSKGAVHRDLKPGNIMLTEAHDGSIKPVVLDFGVAKLVGEPDGDLTEDDGMIGTPGWWAPEQARGNRAVDARGDEYQLGAVMYACVTGRKPFEGRGVSLVHEVAAGRFPPPSRYATDLPNGFEAVLLKMMAPEPEDRYPTMRSVARALLPFASQRVYHVWEPVFEEGRTIPPPG
jgi:serine/threonine-protein kinase